jgi:hypothetical protein
MSSGRSIATPLLPVLVAVCAAVPTGAEPPRLDALEPGSVTPHGAFTLVLRGAAFESGATVGIEGVTAGRFLAYRPDLLTADRCELTLPLGFGPHPAQRQVFVENPDGERSQALTLRIELVPAPPSEVEPNGPAAPAADGVAAEVSPSAMPAPVVHLLHPASLPAGRAVVLEVHGEHFEAAARVWIAANLHAGSSRLPEYGLRPFETGFVDEGLLEVELDRGFYPVPGVREVLVENPGGARSAPALLTIRREEE